METAIEVADLVVERGGRPVLHGMSCAIPRGSITGLLGPSGSGKTTVLRVIVGVQRITSSTVTVLDRPAGHPSLRHEIGYTTQVPSVYGDLSVADNVRYHATLHGRRWEAADEVIVTVGLDPVLRRDLWALFAALAADGATLLVSSHVMDEASRCGRLLLREGRLIADDTPDGLRSATGTHDLDEAFLRIVEHREVTT
jgi:ABC-2 type transport system ATP-binding protein